MGTRTQILVRGIVQGVGFRPYVYSLATKSDLKGWVLNNSKGVLIDVEGKARSIEKFIADLKLAPPPLSVVETVESKILLSPAYHKDFRIVQSRGNGERSVPVSADTATCVDCLSEMFDPGDRRFGYPFINCTNCGPRFTIVENIPYDRKNTTMRDFEMCAPCQTEYEDSGNRRFHAEATCCTDCGPRLSLRNAAGEAELSPDLVGRTRKLLEDGEIVAIKGIGGYHLACDALNANAVSRLRQRKYREDKPFALMAASESVIKQYCDVSVAEAEVLQSRARPIVLLVKKENAKIPTEVAPGVATLGFMLPSSPLHYLFFEGLDRPLVMTSGNILDEPIVYQDRDAAERLNKIADYCLMHDRRIHIRTDDSIVRVARNRRANAIGSGLMVLRRSRGFAPAPIKTSFKFNGQILACGAELKNTFCLAKDNYAFLSHHIGDLENLETLRSFTDGIEHFKRVFDLQPEIIAYDLHPEYLSTKYAHSCDGIGTKIGIQHHHAHIASCLADNGAQGEVIGVAMDGLGFGTDAKMWGGEFFVADFACAERIAHLDYVPMPGGAKAISEPWRMAAVYLQRTFGDEFLDFGIQFTDELDRQKWTALASMIESGINCPETSSMGRLFDAVSALSCLRGTVNYEGQAAIALETIADKTSTKSYEFNIADGGIIKSEGLIKQAVDDLLDGVSAAEVSAKFHRAVAILIADVATKIRETRNLNRVALSGGVFQNMFLLETACEMLRSRDFEVLTHSRVPTNDGGISLGQAAIANAQIRSGRI